MFKPWEAYITEEVPEITKDFVNNELKLHPELKDYNVEIGYVSTATSNNFLVYGAIVVLLYGTLYIMLYRANLH